MQDILTEAEAQTRWCPFVRVALSEEVSAGLEGNRPIRGMSVSVVNRSDSDKINNNCVASECMAWRLAHKDAADGTERGYCGAFGLPRFI